MKIVNQSITWIQRPKEEQLKIIEQAARTCYQSATKENPKAFIAHIIDRGHLSVIEHVSASIKLITDRRTSHQLVRHRLASYSQESTRYCNYSKERFGSELTFVKPVNLDENTCLYAAWECAMKRSEFSYFEMIALGASPEEANAVLPQSTKTELIMTANLREWRHIFKMRCTADAHPQIKMLMKGALIMFADSIPVLFDDLAKEFVHEH